MLEEDGPGAEREQRADPERVSGHGDLAG
jgi:hypothetical protein